MRDKCDFAHEIEIMADHHTMENADKEERKTGTITTTPKTGPFAGLVVFTNQKGEEIFTCRKAGTQPQQHAGTEQTPTFTNSKQLAAWLRRNYPAK